MTLNSADIKVLVSKGETSLENRDTSIEFVAETANCPFRVSMAMGEKAKKAAHSIMGTTLASYGSRPDLLGSFQAWSPAILSRPVTQTCFQ